MFDFSFEHMFDFRSQNSNNRGIFFKRDAFKNRPFIYKGTPIFYKSSTYRLVNFLTRGVQVWGVDLQENRDFVHGIQGRLENYLHEVKL